MNVLQELDWLDPSALAKRIQYAVAGPPSAERDLEIAFLYIAAADFAQAAPNAESAFAATPENAYAAYACGVVRIQQRDWERGLESLLRIPVDFERAGEVAALCSVALFELGRVEEADRVAGNFTAGDDETHGTLAALRGRCAAALGKAEEAALFFDEAMLFAPKLEWVRKARASLNVRPSGADVAAVVI